MNSNNELDKLINYCKIIAEDFSLKLIWNFNGMINLINRSNIDLHEKFVLLAIIDILQGKVKNNNLSIIRR